MLKTEPAPTKLLPSAVRKTYRLKMIEEIIFRSHSSLECLSWVCFDKNFVLTFHSRWKKLLGRLLLNIWLIKKMQDHNP